MVGVRDAALLARRTPETIRRWVWSGRLSAVKQGNKLLVPVAELPGAFAPDERGPRDLAAWAETALSAMAAWPASEPGSAADLVLADRERRGGR